MADFANKAGNRTGWHVNRYFDNGVSGVIGHLGEPGTGKTYLMGKTAEGCGRIVVFDSSDQYGSGTRYTPLPGFLIADQPGQLRDFFRVHGNENFRILYKPQSAEDEHLKVLCTLLFAVRDVVLTIDEMWMFCSPSHLPQHLRDMTLRGRAKGITLLWNAQRASTVARSLTAVSTEMRIFRTSEPNDLDALGDRVSREAIQLLPRLPDRVFLSVDLKKNWNYCTSDANGKIRVLGKNLLGNSPSDLAPQLTKPL